MNGEYNYKLELKFQFMLIRLVNILLYFKFRDYLSFKFRKIYN
jgi:hypothetical protein